MGEEEGLLQGHGGYVAVEGGDAVERRKGGRQGGMRQVRE